MFIMKVELCQINHWKWCRDFTVKVFIQRRLSHWLIPICIYIVLGNVGNLLALFILSSKTHRRNPCSLHLGIGSLFHIFGIKSGIIPLVYALDYPDPLVLLSLDLWKWRQYTLSAILMIDWTLIVLACIDRFAVSNTRPSMCNWSNLKHARYFTIEVILFWFILSIDIIIIYEDIQNGTYGMFNVYSLIFVIGLVPSLLMIIFGILTIKNLKQVRISILIQKKHFYLFRFIYNMFTLFNMYYF
jgi:hypothetical protein